MYRASLIQQGMPRDAAGGAFIVTLGSAAVLPLMACAPVAMGPATYFADPGQYEYFSCELLAERRKFWAERELEIKLLMDKAEMSSGGARL